MRADRTAAGTGGRVEHVHGTRPRDFALVVLGAVLWGTGGLTGAALGRAGELDPVAVAAWRLLAGGGLLLAGLGVAGRLRGVSRTRAVVRRVVLTAALVAVYQGCYFAAVARVSVSTATLVALGAAPVMVATATALRRRRRPPARTLVALALALSGLALLVTAPAVASTGSADGSGTDVLGVLLALAAAAAFATMTLLNRRPVPGLAPLPLTAWSFTCGGLLLVPLAATAWAGGFGVPATGTGWALLVFLGLVPTAAAWGAYFSGLRTVPATTAALLALLEPLTAAVGAALLLDERLGPAGIAGGIALATAVALLRPRR